jgi:hypothetical protein
MKKYTIVYSYVTRRGTTSFTAVEKDRIETDDLAKLIATEKYDGCVNFIFEGWPKLEGEK